LQQVSASARLRLFLRDEDEALDLVERLHDRREAGVCSVDRSGGPGKGGQGGDEHLALPQPRNRRVFHDAVEHLGELVVRDSHVGSERIPGLLGRIGSGDGGGGVLEHHLLVFLGGPLNVTFAVRLPVCLVAVVALATLALAAVVVLGVVLAAAAVVVAFPLPLAVTVLLRLAPADLPLRLGTFLVAARVVLVPREAEGAITTLGYGYLRLHVPRAAALGPVLGWGGGEGSWGGRFRVGGFLCGALPPGHLGKGRYLGC
jgi:hypothetical protein